MFENIKKRDGRVVEFDSLKITHAIIKAGISEKNALRLTFKVLAITQNICTNNPPEVEEIQDTVEQVLLNSPFNKAAKAYILYREQHNQIRNITTKANVDLVENYIQKLDWKIKENSNMNYSLQGLNNYISSNITSEFWLNQIYPEEIRQAHKNGDLHIHDLSLLSNYCCGWSLEDLLKQGFGGVENKIESAPPKHLRSALGQIVNFFYTLQGEAAGAQALSNFDTLLAPFIRYDSLNYNEVKQALQEFVFNINIPTRVGFQTPFTNITMDLYVPSILKDHPVIIGGKEAKETYSDFQPEMDMINKAFAEVMMDGDAKGRIFTFPIPTYNITKDFDWDNPNLEMIWKMTGKYGIPYFSNFVNSDMSPDDARSMCCRLRLDNRELLKRGGGLFGANPMTGSIGVVTINLPRIGFLVKNKENKENKENKTDFINRLKKLINIAEKSLTIKRKVLENFTENNLYPYTKHYLKDIHSRYGKYWSNHFSTIGIVGMNEACLNFLGEDIGSEKGQAFANEIMDFMRKEIVKIQERTGDLFNLEATPAEGCATSLAKNDKEKYPDIITMSEESPFYTNSSQLPINYTDDIFELLTKQDDLQSKYTGGTVLHLFLGEKIDSIEVVKSLIKKITDNFKLPYFTISPTFSICQVHGYLTGEQAKCPKCNAETEIYSRVVGYFRPIKQWNEGKQAEFKNRKTFKIKK